VSSGDQAHGVPERVPGARDAVVEHEDWGKRTRNLLLVIGAIELAALALRNGRQRAARAATAALGVAGLFFVYETGEHGGELVYSYAGGVGTRSGDAADVERLLLAGLYHQAMADRRNGKPAGAAALFAEMGQRFGAVPGVRTLAVESRWRDAGDVAGARLQVDSLISDAADDRSRRAATILKVDLLAAMGYQDSARAILEPLLQAAPSPRLQAKLDSLR
jgi:hypothetical protein